MPDIICWILVITVAAWTFYSLLFFTFYWYEAVNGRYWEELGRKYSINLNIFAIRSILVSIINLARVWLYWPARYISHYWTLPEEHPTETPIVFVHGYLHNRSAWLRYFKWFKKDGLKHLWTMDLKGKFSGIETYAAQLSDGIDKLLRKYNVDRVDIVAHSMGGLVSRYYVQKLGGSARVRKLVTLGTPHNGTKVAVFVIGKARSQMLPSSDFLTKMEIEQRESLGETELTVLYSDADFMIVPTPLAQVNVEGIRNECVGLVSHIGFIYNRKVYERVLSILTSGDSIK